MHSPTALTRRAALAGAAALPALSLPDAAEIEDPAIGAVRRWLEARETERAYVYNGDDDRMDDPKAVELDQAAATAYWQMVETTPTTAAGLALMLAAHLFDKDGIGIGASIRNVESWNSGSYWHDDRDAALLETLWGSAVAAELLGRVEA